MELQNTEWITLIRNLSLTYLVFPGSLSSIDGPRVYAHFIKSIPNKNSEQGDEMRGGVSAVQRAESAAYNMSTML